MGKSGMGSKEKLDVVSVVTPFYNTSMYLRECIESVLNQTYSNFEYILYDNASDDGSSEIAREYAAIDPRIRLLRSETLIPQVPNYNRALTYISPESRYCKIVQADDWITPECLERMVAVAASSSRIGIVSSLRFVGEQVGGQGLPYRLDTLSGREIVKSHLLGRVSLFGSPTTVFFRSDIVRNRSPFLAVDRFHGDTEACYDIMKEWDFGFVHQVLSYTRREPDSTFGRLIRNDSLSLGDLMLVHRYGPAFLTPSEFDERWQFIQREYYRQLARAVFMLRGSEYWRFHRKWLRRDGLSLEWKRLTREIALETIEILTNPKMTLGRMLRGILAR
jgi:glycosyltransferase involved in cell wall biosynthesis